jgi:hypothetical protein
VQSKKIIEEKMSLIKSNQSPSFTSTNRFLLVLHDNKQKDLNALYVEASNSYKKLPSNFVENPADPIGKSILGVTHGGKTARAMAEYLIGFGKSSIDAMAALRHFVKITRDQIKLGDLADDSVKRKIEVAEAIISELKSIGNIGSTCETQRGRLDNELNAGSQKIKLILERVRRPINKSIAGLYNSTSDLNTPQKVAKFIADQQNIPVSIKYLIIIIDEYQKIDDLNHLTCVKSRLTKEGKRVAKENHSNLINANKLLNELNKLNSPIVKVSNFK